MEKKLDMLIEELHAMHPDRPATGETLDRGQGSDGDRYELYESPDAGENWTFKESNTKPLRLRRAPPAPSPDWRIRADGPSQAFHIEQAVNIPLSQLTDRAGELDPSADWAVVCASGYRSSIAASVLERAGFGHVTNAVGGMDAYRQAGLPGVATAAAGSSGAA